METDPVQNKTDEILSITGQKLIGKMVTGSSSSNMHLNFPLPRDYGKLDRLTVM